MVAGLRRNIERPLGEHKLKTVRDVLVWRRRTIVVASMLALMVAALWITSQPSRYSATAVLQLDTKRSGATIDGPEQSVDMSVIETQIETLKSDTIAAAVLSNLQLWTDPEFVGGSKRLSDYVRPIPIIGDIWPAPPDSADASSSRHAALANAARALTIARVGRSYVAQVTFSSLDAGRAANVANAYAQAYIDDIFQSKAVNAERAGNWMLASAAKLRDQASAAEQAVEDFKLSDTPNTTATAETLKDSRIRLKALEARAQSYRSVYETFLSRTAQALPQQTYPLTDARIIGRATAPTQPASPKTALILMLAGLAGAAAGFVIAFFREQSDPIIRASGNLEPHGIFCLGTVPRIRGRAVVPKQARLQPPDIADRTESLHYTILAIREAASNGQNCVVGVVSVHPGEGKSTLAYNLACVLADADRTALVDWNLRSPGLTQTVSRGTHAQNGKNDIGADGDSIRHNLGFDFVAAPQFAKGIHPATAFASSRMQDAISAYRASYRYTIIELPSLKHADACAVALMLDAFVLVVEARRTGTSDLLQSLSMAQPVADRLIGVVVNKAS